jgi:O-antigen/teichoic acid export membrane protein
MPYLTNNLTTKEYGIISIFSIIQLFLLPIIGFSSIAAVQRQYFNKQINFSKYIGNSIILLFFSIFLVLFVFIIFSQTILNFINLSFFWFFMVVLTTIMQYVLMLRLVIFQVSQKSISFLYFNLLGLFLNIFMTWIFISKLNLGMDGRLFAIIFSTFILSLISIFSLCNEHLINLQVDKTYLRDAFIYSAPLIFHSISGAIIGLSDRFLISNLIGMDETGIYSVAFQISASINLLSTAINNAYVPRLFKSLDNFNVNKKEIVKFTYYWYGLLTSGFLVYMTFQDFFHRILMLFISKKYYGVFDLLPYLLLATIFNSFYLTVVNYLFYMKKTLVITIITVILSVFNILLTYFFLNWFGLVGAAYSMSITYCLLFAIIFIVVYIKFPLPWFYFMRKKMY